jgi:hypothetical protein
MRHRTLGLAAAVLLATPLIASCTRPPGNGGPTTTMPDHGDHGDHGEPSGPGLGPLPKPGDPIPGRPASLKECGTINRDNPATSAENTSASCFLGYHGFAAVHLTITSNSGVNVIVVEAYGHSVRVIRGTNGKVTKATDCSGANSQFSVNGSGNLTGILGNTCNF